MKYIYFLFDSHNLHTKIFRFKTIQQVFEAKVQTTVQTKLNSMEHLKKKIKKNAFQAQPHGSSKGPVFQVVTQSEEYFAWDNRNQ